MDKGTFSPLYPARQLLGSSGPTISATELRRVDQREKVKRGIAQRNGPPGHQESGGEIVMLMWLASYPRSGNSLTQQILWQCFGINVAAPVRAGKPPLMSRFRGPSRYEPGTSLEDIVEAARADPDLVIVKTHEMPSTQEPAIVVVRDGRPVMLSFSRFRSEKSDRAVTIEQIIKHPRKSWSEHVTAWLDHDAPKIVLRYEKLANADQSEIDAISNFIGKPQIGRFTGTVDELREIRPTLVQEASNDAGIEEIERNYSKLFWSRHGTAMDRLGYTR